MDKEIKNTQDTTDTNDNVQENENNNVDNQEQEDKQVNKENKPKDKGEKLFTQADIDKIINSKFAKWKTQQENDVKEAERKANMTAEEKLEEDRKKLETEIKQFEYDKLVTKTSKELMKQNLPAEFADFLVAEDAEATNQRVEIFKKAFEDAVEKVVNARFKNPAPKASAGTKLTGGISSEQFKKMTMMQRAKLKQEKPEVYAELTKDLR